MGNILAKSLGTLLLTQVMLEFHSGFLRNSGTWNLAVRFGSLPCTSIWTGNFLLIVANTGVQDNSGGKGSQGVSSTASPSGRSSSELRSGCSGLCPIRAWKLPRTEPAQPPWAICTPVQLSSGVKGVIISCLNLSSFKLCP